MAALKKPIERELGINKRTRGVFGMKIKMLFWKVFSSVVLEESI